MDSTGKWLDEAALDDCWGRCLWGLAPPSHTVTSWIRKMAPVQFRRAAKVWLEPPARAMACAVLGAAEVITVHPDHSAANKLLTDYAVAPRAR